jgi:diamine N-acetyltransferase
MSAPTIRRATTGDAAALAEFCTRTFRETYEAFNTEADMALHLRTHFTEEIQRGEIADPDAAMLIAEHQGALAAYAKLRRGTGPACVHANRPVEVQRFYVDRPWQGRGLAYRVMEVARQTAVAFGADVLWLGVWERNPRGIAFYSKCGFVEVGAWTFTLGADVQRDRVLQRPATGQIAPLVHR